MPSLGFEPKSLPYCKFPQGSILSRLDYEGKTIKTFINKDKKYYKTLKVIHWQKWNAQVAELVF